METNDWQAVSGLLPLIALQQTEYQRRLSRFSAWDRLRLRAFYSRHFLGPIESRNPALLRRYRDGMRTVAKDILDEGIPGRLRVLDVGGGVGGLGIALHERVGDGLFYTLLDREGVDERIWYGLRGEGAKYNSLRLAEAFCAANNVAIETVNIDEQRFPSGPFDLIVSTISWGFHYPVATYAECAAVALAPGGRVVMDVRVTATYADEVAASFPGWSRYTLDSTEKYVRLCLRPVGHASSLSTSR